MGLPNTFTVRFLSSGRRAPCCSNGGLNSSFEVLLRSKLVFSTSTLKEDFSDCLDSHGSTLTTVTVSADSSNAAIFSGDPGHREFINASPILNVPTSAFISFWNNIYSLTRSNQHGEAIRLFAELLSRGISPDCYVLPSVVKAAAGLSSLKTGVQVHCLAFVNGHHSDSLLLSSLVHFYLKCDRVMDARKVFDRIPRPNVVACSALLSTYARKGCVVETKELLREAAEMGLELNSVSWNGMIAGFNHSRQFKDSVLMFRDMHSEGFKQCCQSRAGV